MFLPKFMAICTYLLWLLYTDTCPSPEIFSHQSYNSPFPDYILNHFYRYIYCFFSIKVLLHVIINKSLIYRKVNCYVWNIAEYLAKN